MVRPSFALAAVVLVAASTATERVVQGDGFIAATVNGVPAKLRIEAGAPGLPLVSAAIVAGAKLKCGGLVCLNVRFGIGRERVAGLTGSAAVGWDAGKPDDRRVGWLSNGWPTQGDGTVGPAGLPEDRVRFVLRATAAGERTIALPMEKSGILFGSWSFLRGVITVDGERIAVRLDPNHPRSLATAAAGAAIARAQGGTLTPRTGRQEVLFGVERPYRVMTLARPLAVGPVALTAIGVRVTDGAGANTIPQEGDDPSEVVVRGKGKKSPMVLSLGADALARCSSIVFDKPARAIRLSCL